MEKDYTKMWADDLAKNGNGGVSSKGKSGKWYYARPEPYYGLYYRLRDAWNVLWLKADAMYWMIDQDK